MKIEENELNILPLVLKLIGTGTALDVGFMNTFKGLLEMRGYFVESQAELQQCLDWLEDLGLVEIKDDINNYNKYIIRKV